MKKIIVSLTIILLGISAVCQVPRGFNYQAVIRDASGDILPNVTVSLRISILQDNETGTTIYTETHSELTNSFGLVTLVVGEGAPTLGIFMPGGWGLHKHFLKVELDPAGGSTYKHLSTTQLLSVPYAFHAHSVEPGGGLWQKNGSDIYFSSGNVGIGDDSPTSSINILSPNAGISIKSSVSSPLTGNAYIVLDKKSTHKYADINFKIDGDTKFITGILLGSNYRISTSFSTLNGIEVEQDGDLELSNELHSTRNGEANMMPIAYGTINSDGTISTDSGNISVSRSSAGAYIILISGESYDSANYIASATLISNIGLIRATSAKGSLRILTYNSSGVLTDSSFSFVVYKP